MSEKPSYYAIIPASVRYDNRLRANEKLLYGEITALTNKEGYCWASNNYFAELYGKSAQAISKWIKDLADAGYIKVSYVYGKNKEIKERIIELVDVSINVDRVSTNIEGVSINVDRVLTNVDRGYQQKFKENTITTNNTLNNTLNNTYTPTQKETKHKHGEYGHVLLTDTQLNKLIEENDKETIDAAIKHLDEYMQMHGKKYKDCNLAMRKWVIDAVKKKRVEAFSSNDKFNQEWGAVK